MELSIRNVFTSLLANLLIVCGFVRRAKKRAMKGNHILAMYFHNPSKKEFESCIKWLKTNGFTFLSPDDLHSIITENRPLPKGAVLITADDGWRDNESNLVAVADKHQVPITIFVSTEAVEEGAYWWSYLDKAKDLKINIPAKSSLKLIMNDKRVALINEIKRQAKVERQAMTVEQIQKISKSKYVTIGGHTHTHPILVNCRREQLYNELDVSKQKLEAWTGKEIKHFAYPNGDFSEREMRALNELGYKLAFSSEPRQIGIAELSNPYCLPRFGLLEGASLAENICRMTGVWKPLMLKFRLPELAKDENTTIESPVYRSNKSESLLTS
ncbi:polysaccharide deacetylase family protein [Pontibacter sp. HSC-14F20]|uniref:polysaccharide deacetylase family protein n=1 Tax=Pontibacter sp. HSC-14F20 TaxID=2864136 RepID=UPI001C737AAE|nr:polysaccharide deacetylase family protein [Pontibacter sp. HSC-14F20]MBX0332363.1 polysaccharide deacetylase family protein [Pontibacter sp. HSC-14F20]